MHPEHENKLFVHSRDNCIRLLEYESMKGPRIRKRFFGAKCRDLMVRSCVSPDGQYLISGSEDGTPHAWDITSGDALGQKVTRKYECRFLDLVSDISWNPKYNMFALAGFGHHFPVMVYVYQRTEEQLNEILYSSTAYEVKQTMIADTKGVEPNVQPTRKQLQFEMIGKENEHIGNVNVSYHVL